MKQMWRNNLLGKRFGRLVAIRETQKRNKKGSVIWECVCDCGNTVEVASEMLVWGNTTSCGCRKKEINQAIGSNLTFVDGTCVEWLRMRKSRCDNTSGFRGVYKYDEKWRVGIGLRGKRYHIGTFKTFEEAKDARLRAERKLHDGFIDAWEQWNLIAEDNPEWALRNPFSFEVYHEKGEFLVECSTWDDNTVG